MWIHDRLIYMKLLALARTPKDTIAWRGNNIVGSCTYFPHILENFNMGGIEKPQGLKVKIAIGEYLKPISTSRLKC